MFQPPCPLCPKGHLTGSVTYTSTGTELPLLICDNCTFQCDADDYNFNANYCIECVEKGKLSEMKYKGTFNKCEECGLEEEIEHEDFVLSSL